MNVGIIGAVRSTEIVLLTLIKHDFNIVGVLGFNPVNKENVSGWVDLEKTSGEYSIPYSGYQKINEEIHMEWMKEKQPDLLFAVGFSQLLSKEWLTMPQIGCIGFHPTCLPQGRGRAPLAWLILEEKQGAASFFLMGENADDGPIFVQEPFSVDSNDDASSVEGKIYHAIEIALERWLPKLKKGEWNPVPQDESLATWYGKRMPSDGMIDWNMPAYFVDKLIKASTIPHPGAFTFFKEKKIMILKSKIETRLPIKGVTGRVLLRKNDEYLIQCGNGLLWISELRNIDSLNVGDKLGYNVEYEIYKLKNKLD
jgi:methionyl-tRNA formyltransferase